MTRRRLNNNRSGFTLIEIMVALAIVSILTYVLMVSMPLIQGKARDARRMDELENMQHALALYYTDTGSYPVSLAGATFTTNLSAADAFSAVVPNPLVTAQYIPNMVPNYFDSLPVDPLPGVSSIAGCQALGYGRVYVYYSNGEHYKLISNCSSEGTRYDPNGYFFDPGSPTSAWAVSDDMDYTTFTLGWL